MAENQGCAAVYQRGRRLLIGAASTYHAYFFRPNVWAGAVIADWKTYRRLLSIDDTDQLIGSSLRGAFLASTINFGPHPSDPEPGGFVPFGLYDAELAQAFELRNAKRLSTGLRSCGTSWVEETVSFSPLLRDRGTFFYAYREPWAEQHPDVFIRFNERDAVLGRALKDCLAHCA